MAIKILLIVLITLASGILHGRMTNRWGPSAELQQSARFVDSLPETFGEWKFTEDSRDLTDGVRKELGVSTYASRLYSNGKDSVNVMLLSGLTGRLIRHSPHICYAASGNTFLKEPAPVTVTVDGTEHQFKVLPIRPASDLSNDFVVVYGFAHNGVFLAPDTPRLTYHGVPAVEKIQILCRTDSEDLGQIPEYARSFVESLCRHFQTSASAAQ